MKKQLEKNYDPSVVDERIYKNWLDKKYFHAKVDRSKKPYTIVIPPPNITGNLHMGHALDNAMQDILIRWRRMQGFNALWLPGTDHASISTEVRIVNEMAKEGLTKADIGREGFLERAWEWKEQYGSTIIKQLHKLGSSCDWDRERFTMDDGLSRAVNEVFVRLYNKNYIYRGEKIVNWCTKCQTTISDAEVNHQDKTDCFWHVKYKIKDTDEFLQIATTRPETILGDTAVAVNPADERYVKYIGKTCILPIVNREIPIIADDYVDIEFGTGVVKITPAHDPNDFEVGERHGLPHINIMNDDGTLNENAGEYKGLDRYEAREKVVDKLKSLGVLVKTEDIFHSVGAHERCNTTVEPLIKLQWFVSMEEMAKPALDAYKTGELKFVPDRFGKIYTHWLENIRDWCISRQLWWGHRIPAYYCGECGHINVSADTPAACEKCGSKSLTRDEDTLDTWFSSALWPFSTLGWPDKTEELDYFYPTDVLVTGYDIIFFWVVRMVFSGLEQMGQLPFKDVLIHGLIRDAQGRKMSKSLGNGIDPLEIIEKYGADALRMTLVTGNAPGNDLRFHIERVEASRNFSNKIWNAAKFLLMNLDGDSGDSGDGEPTAADKWILSRLSRVVKEVTDNLEGYDLGIAAQKVQDFIWDEFCDWYIEMVKPRLYNRDDETRPAAINTLKTVLIDCLKLLHPFMPFITEEIFISIQSEEETIMLSKWPECGAVYEREEKEVELIKTAVKSIRNIRSEMSVAPSKRVTVYIVSENEDVREIFEHSKVFFQTLSFASGVLVMADKDGIDEKCVSMVIPGGTIYLPFAELVDVAKERERLTKEKDRLAGEVKRAEGKLNNKGFVDKAPEAVINEERAKYEKYLDMLSEACKQLEALS